MTELIFGCWTIGKWHFTDVFDDESIKALMFAYDKGVSMYDTAPVYGFGHSEKILGQAFHGKREKVFLMTKCGLDWETGKNTFFFNTLFQGQSYDIFNNLSPIRIELECDLSLKRLNTDYIDLYQIHWKDNAVPIVEAAESLEMLKKKGKIRNWGVCNINTGDLNLLAKKGLKPYSLQFKYSLVNRKPEKSVIPYCKKHKIKLFGYSPFEQGLIAGAVNFNRTLNVEDGRNWLQNDRVVKFENIRKQLKKMTVKYDVPFSALILKATADISKCDGLITGMRLQSQVEENIAFQNIELSKFDIENIVNSLNVL